MNLDPQSPHATELLQHFKEYFDEKYPCSTDNNCGDDMPYKDKKLWELYNSLLQQHLTAPASDNVGDGK